jgi:hypothetical protein
MVGSRRLLACLKIRMPAVLSALAYAFLYHWVYGSEQLYSSSGRRGWIVKMHTHNLASKYSELLRLFYSSFIPLVSKHSWLLSVNIKYLLHKLYSYIWNHSHYGLSPSFCFNNRNAAFLQQDRPQASRLNAHTVDPHTKVVSTARLTTALPDRTE